MNAKYAYSQITPRMHQEETPFLVGAVNECVCVCVIYMHKSDADNLYIDVLQL